MIFPLHSITISQKGSRIPPKSKRRSNFFFRRFRKLKRRKNFLKGRLDLWRQRLDKNKERSY